MLASGRRTHADTKRNQVFGSAVRQLACCWAETFSLSRFPCFSTQAKGISWDRRIVEGWECDEWGMAVNFAETSAKLGSVRTFHKDLRRREKMLQIIVAGMSESHRDLRESWRCLASERKVANNVKSMLCWRKRFDWKSRAEQDLAVNYFRTATRSWLMNLWTSCLTKKRRHFRRRKFTIRCGKKRFLKWLLISTKLCYDFIASEITEKWFHGFCSYRTAF